MGKQERLENRVTLKGIVKELGKSPKSFYVAIGVVIGSVGTALDPVISPYIETVRNYISNLF